MRIEERMNALVDLGDYIRKMEGRLEFVIRQAKLYNGWFTVENTKNALTAIESQFLTRAKLENWIKNYPIENGDSAKRVGLILAGNIPLVGFQDVMNVFMAGHIGVIKYSDKDKYLIPHLLKVMCEMHPQAVSYFETAERLKNFDAVIATGSNNSSRYFETYFKNYPNIIRKNRNSVAVLDGTETEAELRLLAKDVFDYFGLGCRNVSKIYVPQGYDFNPILEVFHDYKHLANHGKYKNNFDYNIAFQILNRTPYYNNGCIILVESERLESRIAQLNYEFVNTKEEVIRDLNGRKSSIQCIVSKNILEGLETVTFGATQQPSLWDYADGVDTMDFLTKLSNNK